MLNKDFEPWMKLNNNKYNIIEAGIFFPFLFFFFAIFALLICTHKNIFWNYFLIFFLEVFTVFLNSDKVNTDCKFLLCTC